MKMLPILNGNDVVAPPLNISGEVDDLSQVRGEREREREKLQCMCVFMCKLLHTVQRILSVTNFSVSVVTC